MASMATQKFSGKTYYLAIYGTSRRDAAQIARNLRQSSYKARMGTKTPMGFVPVYTRPKLTNP